MLDAYLAALTIESGSECITTDGHYGRFPQLWWLATLFAEPEEELEG